jgi:hypothetical protein
LHFLNHVIARDITALDEIHRVWEGFQSLASELILSRGQIYTVDESEGTTCNIADFIASDYGLSTGKITLSEVNKKLPKLDHLLQIKQRRGKLLMK